MKLLKLVFRNLLGNGLKTWLNVFVLSLSFVLIIFMQGLIAGWDRQAMTDTVKWEIADGQYWNYNYDPFDPFSLDSAASLLPRQLKTQLGKGQIEPILVIPGTIYPSGRSMALMMKGIRPEQKLLDLPTNLLKNKDSTDIPAIIGTGMAHQTGLKVNDYVTVRWRDVNGTFEAQDIRIAGIFKTFVPAVDNGQIWISLETLQKITLNQEKATILIKSKNVQPVQIANWNFKNVDELTKTLRETLQSKVVAQSIFYIIFLMLALLAVFDTQTLSIFRRQREIGTFVALGMTQKDVIWLFTLEGTMNAVLAIILGAIYGIPLFFYYSLNGIPMPSGSSDFGVSIADKIYPAFPPPLVLGTIVFIILITALVSYLPARKIARMKPTDAIKGKIQ
ncbi:MAG: ABC transporter permease [Paludibacteraceae bacterium]